MTRSKQYPPDVLTVDEINQKQYPRKWALNKDDYEKMEYFSLSDWEACRYGSEVSEGDLNRDLDALIATLQKIRHKFPKEAKVVYWADSTGCYYEGDRPSCKFVVARPETDEEYAARVQKAMEAAKQSEEYQRRQYEELKKKFEGKK